MTQTPETIRLILVDDHEMFAEGVARLLAKEPGFVLAGIASRCDTGIGLARESSPDIAIVDYQLPDGDGASLAGQILTVSPTTRVLMLTGSADPRALISAIDAGCAGFVTKDKAFAELVTAVRLVHGGEAFIPPALLASLLPRMGRTYRGLGSDLTPREREILQVLATGAANQAIADQPFLSVHTVRNHVQNILVKLDAHSKLEAVAIAVREGLITSGH